MNRLFGAPKPAPSKAQPSNPQPPPVQPKAQLPEKNYDLSETSKRVIFLFLNVQFKCFFLRWKEKSENYRTL